MKLKEYIYKVDVILDWTPDSVAFKSAWGDASHTWTYNYPGQVPIPGAENLRINFHLFNGPPPIRSERGGIYPEFICHRRPPDGAADSEDKCLSESFRRKMHFHHPCNPARKC